MGTAIVLAILALAAGAAIGSIYRRKKAGRGCCGGSCDRCCRCADTSDCQRSAHEAPSLRELSLSKKSHNAPFSCIIEEKGAKSWNSGEKMPGRSQ